MSISKDNLSKEMLLEKNVGNLYVDKTSKSIHNQLMNEIVKGQSSIINVFFFIIFKKILPTDNRC